MLYSNDRSIERLYDGLPPRSDRIQNRPACCRTDVWDSAAARLRSSHPDDSRRTTEGAEAVPRQSQSTPTSKRTAPARTRTSARKQADVAKVTDLSTRRHNDELTERQKVILDVIRDSVNKRGYPPSIREICEAAGLASTSSVAHQLSVLERKGYLRRDPNRPRAVDVRSSRAKRARQASEAPPGAPAPVFVPLVGRIAAGGPILAEEMVEDVFALPRALVGDGTLFLLRVAGAAMIDGAATVKTLQRRDGQAWLLPHNAAYQPIDASEATILGKVVSVLRKV